MKLLDDTRNANASFYLDEDGDEIDRAEFMEALWTGANTGVLLYHGPGFVKLQVAVLTTGEDVSSPYGAFEDWCRKTGRLDEIGEDDPQNEDFGTYQSSFQFIPAVPSNVLTIQQDKMGALHIWKGVVEVETREKFTYTGSDRPPDFYLQFDDDKAPVLGALSEGQREELGNGWPARTDRVDWAHLGNE